MISLSIPLPKIRIHQSNPSMPDIPVCGYYCSPSSARDSERYSVYPIWDEWKILSNFPQKCKDCHLTTHQTILWRVIILLLFNIRKLLLIWLWLSCNHPCRVCRSLQRSGKWFLYIYCTTTVLRGWEEEVCVQCSGLLSQTRIDGGHILEGPKKTMEREETQVRVSNEEETREKK